MTFQLSDEAFSRSIEVVQAKYAAFCAVWKERHNEEVDVIFLLWWDNQPIPFDASADKIMALIDIAYRAWQASRSVYETP